MTPDELARREHRARSEPLVISHTEDGYRVYSATNPSRIYEVAGPPGALTCSCPDFVHHAADPDWRCKHVLAVMDQVPGEEAAGGSTSHTVAQPAARHGSNGPINGSTMLIKRSVSPDGKIDAMSVEFSLPVDTENGEAEARAERILALQNLIAGRFLNGEDGSPARPERSMPGADGTVPATIVGMGEADTRRGRRLFLRFQVGERMLRRYGSWQKLAELVAQAGYPEETENLQEGTRLDLPCRVRLEHTRDGRYLNVAEVRPAIESGARA